MSSHASANDCGEVGSFREDESTICVEIIDLRMSDRFEVTVQVFVGFPVG